MKYALSVYMAPFKGYRLSKHPQHVKGQSADLTAPRNGALGQKDTEMLFAVFTASPCDHSSSSEVQLQQQQLLERFYVLPIELV